MLTLAGCGKSRNPETFEVSGTLKISGQAYSGVVLKLIPTSQELKAIPNATTDGNGEFRFRTFLQGDGAPKGEYKLVFFWPPSIQNQPFMANTNQDGYSGPPDVFAGQYFDPETSSIQVNVKDDALRLGVIEVNPDLG